MKKILGLDLGSASIGWALITADANNAPHSILGLGSRVVPLSTDDANEFAKGNAISKNQKRTQRRTQRKGYDRYQLRRASLTLELRAMNMLPDERLIKLAALDLWALRARAVAEQVSLPELGRILYHINQKRGYRHSRADENNDDKKQTEYVQAVNGRYEAIRQRSQTIGQHFYEQLRINPSTRIKDEVFPRAAYQEEFDAIIGMQSKYYPEVLTEKKIDRLRNEIIFYQRKLRSCKHLVSVCEFEKQTFLNAKGEPVESGPKVAPRTSPLFQVCKLWESLNNIDLRNRNGECFALDQEHRQAIFDHLDNNGVLTLPDLYRILGIGKRDGWWGGKAIGKGIAGNSTKQRIGKALGNYPGKEELLRFELNCTDLVDKSTGEVVGAMVDRSFEKEPLYRLWHTLYSISDKEELAAALGKNFGIHDPQILDALCNIDFTKDGFGNKSAKAIRRILPYLKQGMKYSEACAAAGFRHSESLSTEENAERALKDRLDPIAKNELRQPVVEKIINQMINVVNALIDKHGPIDEIRMELARDLKQSREERNKTFASNNKRERENKELAERIEEYGLAPSRSRIEKYRLWQESDECCFYCGQPLKVNEFLLGYNTEVEHVIPRSLFFDNSFHNKVCACRKCNQDKGRLTGFDFMRTKSEEMFENYKNRVADYYKSGRISKTKCERLLTSEKEIPGDFIERQLRQTQYISRKSKEILSSVCRNVWATSGSVTDFVRHAWGYDRILHNLNFERYERGGLTETVSVRHSGQTHEEQRIKDWSKRFDHRHHAIDALTIACTRQGFIQRINNLSSETVRREMFDEIAKQVHEEKKTLLEQWISEQPHFTPSEVACAAEQILISFKPGKKAASTGTRAKYDKGKRIVVQEKVIVPRGPLSEESVYGRIKQLEQGQPVKYLFENPETICKPRIRKLVEERLAEFDGDKKQALASLKKRPIYLDHDQTVELQYASCYSPEYVLRYPVASLKATDLCYVVDQGARRAIEERLGQFGNDHKTAFKDLENNPIFLSGNPKLPIKRVRLLAKLNAIAPVRFDESGNPIGFVVPGNNHHIAVYSDRNGVLHEHVATFWHAVERKKYGLPVVVTRPEAAWDEIGERQLPESFLNDLPDPAWTYVMSMQQNEMFVMGLDDETFRTALADKNYALLSAHLYRVQSISKSDYFFRHHLITKSDNKYGGEDNMALSIKMGIMLRVKSLGALTKQNPQKVRITLLGEIKHD